MSSGLRGRGLLLLVWTLAAFTTVARADGAADAGYRVTVNGTAILVYGNGSSVFDPRDIPGDDNLYNTTQHIGLNGVVLAGQLPAAWSKFKALRSLSINCAPPASNAASSGGGAGYGSKAGSGNVGSSSSGFLAGPSILNSTQLLGELKQVLLSSKQGVSVESVSIVNCGMQGTFSRLWRDYLSGVRRVNLSGNALTGGFEAIDDFDGVCTDDFAGDDYGEPDCSSASVRLLDVSRNSLSGAISSGAALGDDVTDALCSSGCLSLVLGAGGLGRAEVMCRAPLVVLAMSNPGLHYPRHVLYASGYLVGDRANWCFQPASRAVLPAMWGVFLALLAATLGVTLYARIRTKRVPFRMTSSPSFDVLGRSGGALAASASSSDYPHPHPASHTAHAASASSAAPPHAHARPLPRPRGGSGSGLGGYCSLPDGSVAIEMAERQAMVP
ncbi:hypothetical protein Agub_g8134, partial [Astrephomene gubernaculifera]